MVKNYPNILIVSGNGRNSGKTTLACEIIEKFSQDNTITGIKISPHYHTLENDDNIIARESKYTILKEEDMNSGKDSSRMLKAGAGEVFYIQSDDKNLEPAFKKVLEKVNKNSLIVCESGGLRRFITPGIFFLLNRKDVSEFKAGVSDLLKLADRLITFDGSGFDFSPANISVTGKSWKIIE